MIVLPVEFNSVRRFSMPLIPADMGPLRFAGGRFIPHGPIDLTHLSRRWHGAGEAGARENPRSNNLGQYAARIVVGLKVKDDLRWTLEHVMALVLRMLSTRSPSVAASFVSQHGFYTYADGNVVNEPSVQVVIIDEERRTRRQFDDAMLALTETLCTEMRQESAILEIQHRGRSVDLALVVPRSDARPTIKLPRVLPTKPLPTLTTRKRTRSTTNRTGP
ncbi:MAG: hypothetical protein R3A48_24635 [Polyangiales bacterium]